MDDTPDSHPIPPEGALGLLALGYRGLEAWREARGTDWIEQRRVEWEAGRGGQAERARQADEAGPGAPGAS